MALVHRGRVKRSSPNTPSGLGLFHAESPPVTDGAPNVLALKAETTGAPCGAGSRCAHRPGYCSGGRPPATSRRGPPLVPGPPRSRSAARRTSASSGSPRTRRSGRPLEVREHEDVEQLGPGSGAEGRPGAPGVGAQARRVSWAGGLRRRIVAPLIGVPVQVHSRTQVRSSDHVLDGLASPYSCG